MDRYLVPSAISRPDPCSVGLGRLCTKVSHWDDAGSFGTGLSVGRRHRRADMRSLYRPVGVNGDCPGTTTIGRVVGTITGRAAPNRSRHW